VAFFYFAEKGRQRGGQIFLPPVFILPERGLNAPICKGGFWEIAESGMVV
jgi:hypothetical protein